MRNCENCYHYHMCDLQNRLEDYQECKYFKDKSLIVELPCKVGDVVYKLGYTTCKNGESYPDSYGCCGCEDECDMKITIIEVKVPTRGFIIGTLMDGVGASMYYFTREEAEKVLEERESNAG